jgi:hypothetical protein
VLRTFRSKCPGEWYGVKAEVGPDELLRPLREGGGEVKDQRHFDYLCYLLWRVAAREVEGSKERGELLAGVGRSVAGEVMKGSLASLPSEGKLSSIVTLAFKTILDEFVASGLVEGYRVQDGDGVVSGESGTFDPFDGYDDSDFELGREVNLVISLKRPAWLASALQVNGESGLFAPEFLAPALRESLGGTRVGCKPVQNYFVDDVYRPNPTEFYPTEELLQFTLFKK